MDSSNIALLLYLYPGYYDRDTSHGRSVCYPASRDGTADAVPYGAGGTHDNSTCTHRERSCMHPSYKTKRRVTNFKPSKVEAERRRRSAGYTQDGCFVSAPERKNLHTSSPTTTTQSPCALPGGPWSRATTRTGPRLAFWHTPPYIDEADKEGSGSHTIDYV